MKQMTTGLCECGCGGRTRISEKTDRSRDYIKGVPRRFIYRHNGGPPVPVSERFWAKVEKTDSCWNWTASIDRAGYGRVRNRLGTCLAHRIAYELLIGPIPAGLVLDHLCKNTTCVNPDHLEPVTDAENRRRGDWIAANTTTHCQRGHALDAVTAYVAPPGTKRPGTRYCRKCAAITAAHRRQNKGVAA